MWKVLPELGFEENCGFDKVEVRLVNQLPFIKHLLWPDTVLNTGNTKKGRSTF